MTEEIWTPAEQTRALKKYGEQLGEMQKKLDALPFVRLDIYDRDRAAVADRMSATEESLRWFRRLVIGAFVTVCAPFVLLVLTARGGG